jgi:putative oxidoreductase
MKTNALHFGLLLLRIGFSAAMLTHGYGKFMKVLAGDFSFGDPIGIYVLLLNLSLQFFLL